MESILDWAELADDRARDSHERGGPGSISTPRFEASRAEHPQVPVRGAERRDPPVVQSRPDPGNVLARRQRPVPRGHRHPLLGLRRHALLPAPSVSPRLSA